ncbi:SusC/RagA family TonB-linked outer membrane protein [Hufsiella ginkgonis]|uniref:SusC/RagA family TonB-linked outer membrane protein n=1 Tax=Hufsiella ginkgonis TaxID=2695274 RepID=A0A7K1XYA5_9SPHI|nr:SusC/RagA family TonB-linked outer membrane protein [Hufsiella ginkgonis]MXV15984.1 SusC/RagA family TonB-linked outer membrane protein [Hufsiella ginkgonis]
MLINLPNGKILSIRKLLCLIAGISLCVPQLTKAANDKNGSTPATGNYLPIAVVTGKVVDQANMPLPGVNVVIKGTTASTTTNADGIYSIKNVPDNAVLVFSYVGYLTQEIPARGETLNVTMTEKVNDLSEVVVVGYGTRQKRDLTGAISQVKATQLENQHPNSVQDLLRGNVPGLNVAFSASPKGGGNGDLQVRGRASLIAGTTPLLVVDGVIYPGQLSDINPSDIETIDVLKDASSAAVYGAKAASGVVIISTKKGKASKPTVNINTTTGVASREVTEHVYDAAGFVNWRTEVLKSINVTTAATQPYRFNDPRTLPPSVTLAQWFAYDATPATADPVNTWLTRLKLFPVEIANYNAGKETSWEDLIYTNGRRQDHTMSLSGRKEEITYYMSGGYTNNNGLTVGDQYKNARARLNLEGRAAKFATVGVNFQYAGRDESAVPIDYGQVKNASPLGEMFQADGVTLRSSPNDDFGNNRNPFLDNYYRTRVLKYNTIFSSLFVKGELPYGFSYSVNLTPSYDQTREFNHYKITHPDYTARKGYANRTGTTRFNWQIDNVLKWNKTFASKHQFDVTLLANAEKLSQTSEKMENEGFDPNDKLGYHNMGAGIKPVISSNDIQTTGDALMARLNYTLASKYMITGTVRRDGYSAFGQKNPRATFPSVALGWVFSDESFVKKANWLNYGKLRLSYGGVGNRDIDGYLALSDLSTGKYLYVTQAGVVTPVSQLFVNRMTNKDLKWETTYSLNGGLDFAVLNNRIDGSVEIYNRDTRDLLLNRALADVTGFTSVASNLGSVRNRGFELALNTKNVQSKNVSWRSTLNFALNRNKIVHLFGKVNQLDAKGNVIGQIENDDIANNWFIGKDINVIWDYRVLGVWQTEEAAEALKYGVKPGDFKVQDLNGDLKYTNADKQFLGSRNPKFTTSLRNEFNLFKKFDFSFSMYSYWGAMTDFNEAKNNAGFQDRQNSYKLPFWTAENPINDYARLYSSNGSANYSVYRKTSFIRLDNVSLAYTLPKSLVQRARISNVRVFGTVQNAAIYTREWEYWDPQNKNPTPRYSTLGLNVTL